MQIVINVKGGAKVIQILDELRRSPEEIVAAVTLVVRRQTVDRFNTKQGPDGPWAAWRPSTKRSKARKNTLMIDTGRLMGSINSSVSGKVGRVGTNVGYAVYHQEGTTRMTARPIVGVSAANVKEIETLINRYIQAAIAA